MEKEGIMDNNVKNPSAEAEALQAVERHHAEMLKHLNGLVALLTQAVEAGDTAAGETAQATLLDWCDSQLIPHALAEEGPLYSGPGATPEGRLLVEGMLAEHKVIVGLVEELRTANGISAVVAGAAIQRMFGMHLDKENRLLMPFIVASPDLSLADSVKGLHELVGGSAGHHAGVHDGGPHHH
ncbi:hemerythrin domain-containing protein [Pseudarthrobacter phenanthrenivorans]|nr:hemerythrin domain-containing protein [Pseudarthrobacter phenanthrenivorans]